MIGRIGDAGHGGDGVRVDLCRRGMLGDPAAHLVGQDQLRVEVRQRHEASRVGEPQAARSRLLLQSWPVGGRAGPRVPPGSPPASRAAATRCCRSGLPRFSSPFALGLYAPRASTAQDASARRGRDHAEAPEHGQWREKSTPVSLGRARLRSLSHRVGVRSRARPTISGMPRVLVLARYFPPIGGAGVHRTVGSVRHLPVARLRARRRDGPRTAARPLGRARPRAPGAHPGAVEVHRVEGRAARADRLAARLARVRPGRMAGFSGGSTRPWSWAGASARMPTSC